MEIIRDLEALRPHPFPVVALGNFDGVHVGHQAILKAAIERAHAEHGSAFALTFDPLPAKVLLPERAPRLIPAPDDKAELLPRYGADAGQMIVSPPANIASRTQCLPPDRVYATRLVLPDGAAHASITNIGMRPTFAEPERTIEAHIFDFDRDIYDANVKLELIERIRPERKFESPQALAAQIASDLNRAKEILASA